jgi:large exoprotein involved in heme utilization and adhesion
MTIQGTSLQVPEGKGVSVVGGDVQIVGGKLMAPSGRVQIASVASPGEVRFTPLEVAPDLQVDSFARLGRLEIAQGTLLDASGFAVPGSGGPGGTVLIRSGRLLVDRSSILANTMGDVHGASLGLDLWVVADAVITGDSAVVASRVMWPASSRSGNIVVKASNLTLTDGASIDSSSQLLTSGRSGDIMVNVGNLTLKGGAFIDTSTSGTGNGGHLTVIATDTVTLSGHGSRGHISEQPSGLFTSTFGDGRGGDVILSLRNLRVTDGATINSSSAGNIFEPITSGTGGNVMVTATNSIVISGSESRLASRTRGRGGGGGISISSSQLLMDDGGQIAVDTAGDGRGGNIQFQVGTLSLARAAQITSRSGIEDAVTLLPGAGQGGDIALQAQEIRLTEGSAISAASSGPGNAGNLRLTATEVSLSDHSSVTTDAAKADGGNIELKARSRVQLQDSTISASVGGGPATVGGNLTIDAPFVVVGASEIVAQATRGMGGRIQVDAQAFLADPDSLVSASSTMGGINGMVEIRAPVTSLSGALAPLPQAFMNVAALLPARCAARLSGGHTSSLVQGGREGRPLDPGGVLPSPLALDERIAVGSAVSGTPHWQTPAPQLALLALDEKVFPRMRVWKPQEGSPAAMHRECAK